MKEFENAVRINPKSVAGYIVLGSLWDVQKNQAKAAPYYREALKIDPQAPVAANNLAWILAETGGNLDEALKLAQIAREKMPDSSSVADTLGWVLYKRGAYRSAIDLFRECVRLEPKNPVYHYHLGMTYFKAGDRQGAKDALSEATRLNPNFPGSDEARATLAKV